MPTFKDLSDPRLRAELRRRADALKETRRREQDAARAAQERDALQTRAQSTFAAAIGRITPLTVPGKTTSRPPAPAPVPRLRQEDEAAALQSSREAVDPSPMAWDIGLDIEASQSYVRGGLNPDLLRKLRRGEWVVQGSLDLHQHTQDQARSALTEFLAEARRQGWR
ncbi:MAG: hypothetical protein ABI831_04020, partial [Betaproteobacteria bacterium]